MHIEISGHGSLLTFQWWTKLANLDRLLVVALSVRRPVWQSFVMCSSPQLHTILHERPGSGLMILHCEFDSPLHHSFT